MSQRAVCVAGPDGRRIDLHLGGDPNGLPLVLHHGTPGCGRPLDLLDRAFVRHGLRSIGPARPGFGSSGPRGARSAPSPPIPPQCSTTSASTAASSLDGRAVIAEGMAANFRDAVACGIDGWVDDYLAFVAPGGFDIAAIAVPMRPWHGTLDNLCPASHSRWLAERIPGAIAHIEANEGHLSIVLNRIDAMLEELVAVARRSR